MADSAWQRLPAEPKVLISCAGPDAERLMIAFDGMHVPLALLPQLPALLPAVVAALDAVEE